MPQTELGAGVVKVEKVVATEKKNNKHTDPFSQVLRKVRPVFPVEGVESYNTFARRVAWCHPLGLRTVLRLYICFQKPVDLYVKR